MNPTITLLRLIGKYQAHFDFTFEQAVEAMRTDLFDHCALMRGEKPEEPHDH